MDISTTTAPRSDQQNYDDYTGGPKTVTISEVKEGNAEQPVHIHLVEFPGRPFKPCKTVRRILMAAWGIDTAPYAGRRMTLYGDPSVRFGGETAGGIRVSHLSHIDKPLKTILGVSKGRRSVFTVEPLPNTQPASTKPRPNLTEAFERAGHSNLDSQLDYCRNLLKRELTSPRDLTDADIDRVLEALHEDDAEGGEPE